MRKYALLFLILTKLTAAMAEEKKLPTVGLVLSGGGARGAAHIGVIEALEEMQIPIDIIVGTSMGAVIGGIYASGVPIQVIKKNFLDLHWDEIFSYNIRRNDLYYRRKLDNDIFLIKNFISFSRGALHIPYGIITGQSLYETFNSFFIPLQPIQDFDHLSIPFKAVATDLVSGKPVILEKGDLALSLLASMAVPGLISPVEMNDYLLVDGGVTCNLPIEVAKSMGAEIIIAVDVSTPMATKAHIIDLTGVLSQISNILTTENVQQNKNALTDRDILIEPTLDDLETTDFSHFKKGIAPGKIATYKVVDKLRALSRLSHRETFLVSKEKTIEIEKVEVLEENTLNPKTYDYYLNFDSEGSLTEHIDFLYGLSIFNRVYYGIENFQGEKILVVKPKIDIADPLYLQGSILLDTDFGANNTFAIVLGLTNQRANSLLGEWRLLGRIGQGESLLAEYYQPLTANLAWFVNPVVSIQRTPFNLYYDYEPIALYLNTVAKGSFALGRTFSNWGRIKGYWEYEYDDYDLRTGCFELPNLHMRSAEFGLAFEWDTLDNLYFPHHGFKGSLNYSTNSKTFGAQSHYSQLSVASIAACASGKHSFALVSLFNRSFETPGFSSKFFLGGLFQLTGLATDEVFGNNSALLSAVYFYEIKKINFIPNRPLPLYVGASLESGKVWGEVNLSNNEIIDSASIFLAADTIIGPIYFALAATDTGQKAAHLLLRPAFS